MIPSIEDIVEGLASGEYTKSQAVTWLLQHAEGAVEDLRDCFAIGALPWVAGLDTCDGRPATFSDKATAAYELADAMLEARRK